VFEHVPFLVNNATIQSFDVMPQHIPDMTEWPEHEDIATALEKFLTDPRYTKKEKQERVNRTIQALLEEGNIIMDIPLLTFRLNESTRTSQDVP
jgi:FMN-dependent NADH-azoreductase